MTLRVAALVVLVGCGAGGCSRSVLYVDCYADLGSPIALDVESPLGFSANDVLNALDLSATVTVRDVHGEALDRHFTFVFTPDGTATVQDGQAACPDAVLGQSLAIPGTLTVEDSEGWLTARGAATVVATGASATTTWMYGSLTDVQASQALRDAAWADVPDYAVDPSCTAEEVEFVFNQTTASRAPWSTGPRGGIDTHACGYGALGLFTWGASEP